MINKIVIGIAQALNGAFGDDYEIYSQEVKQGLQQPCFLIMLVNSERKDLLGSRKKRNQTFNIVYFPKEGREEIHSTLEMMYEALEMVTFDDGLLNARNMECTIVDDVLSFTVDYNFTTYKPIEGDYMGELILKGSVKEHVRH